MQWILQEFEDTQKLANALDRLQISYTWHKVVPFVGDLVPEPVVLDPNSIVMFGSYTLWRYAEARGFYPGVFRIRPFLHEEAWQPYLLNGTDSLVIKLQDIPELLPETDKEWFFRPVEDSKEEPGRVRSRAEILELAKKVIALSEDEIPKGSLRHDTMLMLTEPAHILKEWRVWVVQEKVVTYSLYKEGARVIYRHEIDDDAIAFAQRMVDLNPEYSQAYVIDICRTEEGLRVLETNCINAAGFYEADLVKLASAIDGMVG